MSTGRRRLRAGGETPLAATSSGIRVAQDSCERENRLVINAPCYYECATRDGGGPHSRVQTRQSQVGTETDSTSRPPKAPRRSIDRVSAWSSTVPERKSLRSMRSRVHCEPSQTQAEQMLFAKVRTDSANGRPTKADRIVPALAAEFIAAWMDCSDNNKENQN